MLLLGAKYDTAWHSTTACMCALLLNQQCRYQLKALEAANHAAAGDPLNRIKVSKCELALRRMVMTTIINVIKDIRHPICSCLFIVCTVYVWKPANVIR